MDVNNKNIWLRYFTIDDLFKKNINYYENECLKIVEKEDAAMRYSIALSSITDNYIEINEWCHDNLEYDFCLWANSFACDNECDFIAFKLRWL